MVKIDGQRKDHLWKKGFKVGKIRFYVSNCRLRFRQSRDGHSRNSVIKLKKQLFEEASHECLLCKRNMEWWQAELHHVLPYGLFEEFRETPRNLMVLCHGCHAAVHNNPYINIQLMEQVAKELGVEKELKSRLNKGAPWLLG